MTTPLDADGSVWAKLHGLLPPPGCAANTTRFGLASQDAKTYGLAVLA